MDARIVRAAILFAALASLGAGRPQYSARSQFFLVTAPTPQLAQEVCQAAEAMRRDLAIEWLGQELPPWRDICPISVKLDAGAGGATSFVFQGGMPTQWTMSIQGTRERILDSVLPHEITHTIFATHFGRPLPRWADEGGATTVEHTSEKTKQDHLLVRFLTTDRGIPFNNMFAMRDYPKDILPLYSQGYSLVRYLLDQGGKRKYVEYIGEGLRTNNWTAATQRYYGFGSLSELQVAWVDWVRQGSPSLAGGAQIASATAPAVSPAAATPVRGAIMDGTQMASLAQQPRSRMPQGALASWQTTQSQNARAYARAEPNQPPPTPFPSESNPSLAAAEPNYSTVSRPVSDGWYVKRRDQAQALLQSPASNNGNGELTPATQQAAADAPRGKVLMEWSRQESAPQAGDLTGLALREGTTVYR
jgi:hypothetical protein